MCDSQGSLAEYAKQVALNWLLIGKNHINPVVHYRQPGEQPLVEILIVSLSDKSPDLIKNRIAEALQKLVREGYNEITISYEGKWEQTSQRVLVVVHYTPEEELTWVADISETDSGDMLVAEWFPIKVMKGEIYTIFQKAEQHLWN